MYACSVVHVTRICCFEFRYLESSLGYLENSLLRTSLSRIFEKDREFFASNPTKNVSKIRRLFMENSREQRTSFDEFRLHNFCTILYTHTTFISINSIIMVETRSPSKEVLKYSFLYLMESELLKLTFFFQVALFLILPHEQALLQEGQVEMVFTL